MSLVIRHKKSSYLNFMEALNLNLESQLNIYNQAVLKRSAAISLLSKELDSANSKDFIIMFEIQGEFDGFLIAQLSAQENIEYSSDHFHSLFVESINILGGKLLTNLDQNFDLLCTLSPPRQLSSFDSINNSKYKFKLKTNYELITLNNTYDCNLIFVGNEKILKEV